MLYERWQEMAREFRHEIALHDLPSARRWTFAELEAEAQQRDGSGPVSFPRGNGPELILATLRAWRHRQITCPLESNQNAPVFPAPPAPIAHLKLTSATTGTAKLV